MNQEQKEFRMAHLACQVFEEVMENGRDVRMHELSAVLITVGDSKFFKMDYFDDTLSPVSYVIDSRFLRRHEIYSKFKAYPPLGLVSDDRILQ